MIQLPKEAAVIQCRGHWRGNASLVRGHALAGKAAETAAKEQPLLPAQLSHLTVPSPKPPSRTPGELVGSTQGAGKDCSGRLTKDNKLLTPGTKQWKIIKHFHKPSHLGLDSLFKLVVQVFLSKGLS